jgi:hypothetical protein
MLADPALADYVANNGQTWELIFHPQIGDRISVQTLRMIGTGFTYFNHPAAMGFGPNATTTSTPGMPLDSFVRVPNLSLLQIPGRDSGVGDPQLGGPDVLVQDPFDPGNVVAFNTSGPDVNIAWGAAQYTQFPGFTSTQPVLLARISFWGNNGALPVVAGTYQSLWNDVSGSFVPMPQIPEPATAGLAALALMAMGLRRRV